MKRTLLAVGFAVLVSMLFAPHEKYWHWLGDRFYVVLSDAEKGVRTETHYTLERQYDWEKYLSEDGYKRNPDAIPTKIVRIPHAVTHQSRYDYTPDWCRQSYWFPIFWLEDRNPFLWGNFAGQTAFLSVLAAALANLPK